MSSKRELSGGEGCLLLIVVLLVIAGLWGYPVYRKAEVVGQFASNHYQRHYVQRVSKAPNTDWGSSGKSELIILLENGDVVKESQFTDDAGSLTQVGDTLDVAYDQDGKVIGARRTKIAPYAQPSN